MTSELPGTADLYHAGIGALVVVSGGSRAVPEGCDFPTETGADCRCAAEPGGPQGCDRARSSPASNASENFWLSAELLRDLDLDPQSLLAVTKPYAERRLLATARRRWPAKAVRVTFEGTGFEEYLAGEIPADRIISGLAGEALRLESYAATGPDRSRRPGPRRTAGRGPGTSGSGLQQKSTAVIRRAFR